MEGSDREDTNSATIFIKYALTPTTDVNAAMVTHRTSAALPLGSTAIVLVASNARYSVVTLQSRGSRVADPQVPTCSN